MKRISEDEIRNITEKRDYIYDHVEYNGKAVIFYYCKEHYKYGLQHCSLASMRNSKNPCGYCNKQIKTDEMFKSDMQDLHPNIKIKSKYQKAQIKVECECVLDGTIWSATPNNLYHGTGCPTCGKMINSESRTKSSQDFEKEIKEKYNGKIVLIGNYNGAKEKVTCQCMIDNTIFDINANNLVNSCTQPCPTCRGLDIRNRCVKSNDDFIAQLKLINPNIVPKEKYIDDHSPIRCYCLIHDYYWYVAPNHLLTHRTGCPKCCSYHNEKLICNYLEQWGYNVLLQKKFSDCRDKYPLPFDIYLPDYNILIEYDGEQHYKIIPRGNDSLEKANEKLEIIQKHDKMKTDYCKNKNIPLIRIPYWIKDELEYFLFDELVKYNAIQLVA